LPPRLQSRDDDQLSVNPGLVPQQKGVGRSIIVASAMKPQHRRRTKIPPADVEAKRHHRAELVVPGRQAGRGRFDKTGCCLQVVEQKVSGLLLGNGHPSMHRAGMAVSDCPDAGDILVSMQPEPLETPYQIKARAVDTAAGMRTAYRMIGHDR